MVANWLALPPIDHKVPGSNPTGGRIQLMTVLHFIAQRHLIIILPLPQYDINKC